MSHEVQSLMFANSLPWHGIGKQVSEDITTNQAIVEAGLDWRVDMVPLYTGKPGLVDPQGNPITVADLEAPAKATIRSDTGEILGVVGNRFHPLQNPDAFKFFDQFLDAGEATLEVAGALCGGKRIFILAKIKRDPMQIVSDDIVEKYILLAHAHDGTLSVHAGLTPIRVVCMNTLRLALSDRESQLIRIRHTARVNENLDLVKETINVADAKFEATAEQYRFLTTREVNQADLERYVRRVFVPGQDENDDETGKRIVNNVTPLFEEGMGNNIAGVRGTWWAAYNAVTQYLTYNRGKDAGKRLNQTWFGSGADINRRALEEAVNFANAA